MARYLIPTKRWLLDLEWESRHEGPQVATRPTLLFRVPLGEKTPRRESRRGILILSSGGGGPSVGLTRSEESLGRLQFGGSKYPSKGRGGVRPPSPVPYLIIKAKVQGERLRGSPHSNSWRRARATVNDGLASAASGAFPTGTPTCTGRPVGRRRKRRSTRGTATAA